MSTYLRSQPGRLLLVAAAIMLFAGGLYGLRQQLIVFALAPPVAVAIALVAVGLSVDRCPSGALFAVTLLPVLLLFLVVGVGLAATEGRVYWGWGFIALGAVAAVKSVFPRWRTRWV